MAKKTTRTNGQMTIYKTLDRKLKIEQHLSPPNSGVNSCYKYFIITNYNHVKELWYFT